MPTLITRFNWGRAIQNANPLLTKQLSEAYTDTALVVNTKISKYVTDVDPPNNITPDQVNANFELADIWVNKSTDSAWIMTSRTDALTVNWQLIT